MSNSTVSDFNVSDLKPETVTKFKKMCSEKRDLLDYLSKFGNAFNKSAASVVLNFASDESRGRA